jgi:hypothetical protein
MSKKQYLLTASLILLMLYSSASALLVNNAQTWTSNPVNIHTLAGHGSYPTGTLEIVTGGSVLATNRVNMDGQPSNKGITKLILNGGTFTSTSDFKFTDNNTDGGAEIWVNSGTFTANKVENLDYRSDRAPALIYIGGGTMILTEGWYGSGSTDYDANVWKNDYRLFAQDGYKLIMTTPAPGYGTGSVKIEGQAVAGAAQKSPFDQKTENVRWPLWWADGTGGPFTSYDVYLGTSQTAVQNADNTRGPCNGAGSLLGDIDKDCSVNSDDFMHLVNQWLGLPSWPSADVAGDPNINLPDFAAVSGDWLDSNPFQGNQTAKKFKLKDRLIPGKTYYWRVDARNGSTVIPGEIRSFTAAPKWQPDKFVIFIGWTNIDTCSSNKAGYLQLLENLGINMVMEQATQIQYLDPQYGIQDILYDLPTAQVVARQYENDSRVWAYFQGSEARQEYQLSFWSGFHWRCHWAAPAKPCWSDVLSINYGWDRPEVDAFIERWNPELLSFDYYEWRYPRTLVENLEYYRNKTLENDIPLYSWVEVTTSSGAEIPIQKIRRSVYMNLLYGVKGISWFTASSIFNKSAGTIANQNNYDRVQEMNVQIKNLGPWLLNLTSTAVYHTGIGTVTKDRSSGADAMVPVPPGHWVQIAEDGFGLGMFQNADGDDYVMVINRVYTDNTSTNTATVKFTTEVTLVEAFDAVAGTWSPLSISGTTPNQQVSLSLKHGAGTLLRITHAAP